MPPRVLMMSFEYGPYRNGGLATLVDTLTKYVARSAFQPVLAVPRASIDPPWTLLRRVSTEYVTARVYRDDVGCEVWVLENELLDHPELYPEPAQRAVIKKYDEYGERLVELLPEMAVDLVHMHDICGYKSMHRARELRLPLLFTVHRLHYDEPHTRFAEEVAVRLADRVTTISETYRRDQEAYFALHELPTEVVRNGIDLEFWREAALRDAGSRSVRLGTLQRQLGLAPLPTIAYVGRFDAEQKGLDVLMEASDLACRRSPFNLVILGEGEARLTEQLRAWSAGRSEWVRLREGHHPADEVRRILAAVDFAVIPSRYEPFGLVQLEAMAMGAVPIASRTGGLADVIVELEGDSGFGLFAEPGAVDSLAEAIVRAIGLASSERIDAVRARGQRHVRDHCGADAMASQYGRLYRTLLDRAPQERRQTWNTRT